MGMKVSDLKIEIKEEITKYIFANADHIFEIRSLDTTRLDCHFIIYAMHEIVDERFEKFYDSKQVNPRE